MCGYTYMYVFYTHVCYIFMCIYIYMRGPPCGTHLFKKKAKKNAMGLGKNAMFLKVTFLSSGTPHFLKKTLDLNYAFSSGKQHVFQRAIF